MDWKQVKKNLFDVIHEMAMNDNGKPVYGQDAAAMAVMDRLSQNGVILADDVGLGKTRVALMLMESVSRAGGTVAVISPSNLNFISFIIGGIKTSNSYSLLSSLNSTFSKV